jgi:hypothetical protein
LPASVQRPPTEAALPCLRCNVIASVTTENSDSRESRGVPQIAQVGHRIAASFAFTGRSFSAWIDDLCHSDLLPLGRSNAGEDSVTIRTKWVELVNRTLRMTTSRACVVALIRSRVGRCRHQSGARVTAVSREPLTMVTKINEERPSTEAVLSKLRGHKLAWAATENSDGSLYFGLWHCANRRHRLSADCALAGGGPTCLGDRSPVPFDERPYCEPSTV